MKVQIRPMENGEEAIVSGMILTVFKKFIASDYDENGVKNFCDYCSAKNIKKRFNANYLLLVAVHEQRIVGVIELQNNRHISMLFVRGECHHKGIGTDLINEIIAKCTEDTQNLSHISVHATKQSIGFYKKIGFISNGEMQNIDGVLHYDLMFSIPARFRGRGFNWIFERPYVVGSINTNNKVDGVTKLNLKEMAYLAKEMIDNGADAIEISAQLAYTFDNKLTPKEEWTQVEEIIKVLARTNTPIFLSTIYPQVAEKALALGVGAINDTSGNVVSEMAKIILKYKAGWILTNNRIPGKFVATSVHNELTELVSQANDLLVRNEHICLNAGLGLKKDAEQNLSLLNNISTAKVDGLPLLLELTNLFKNDSKANINRSIAEIVAYNSCFTNNVELIKVEDVKSAVETIYIAKALAKGRFDERD